MKTIIRTGLIAFAATMGMASSSAYAGCVLAAGESVMVTEDLAKYMASAALKNSIASHNWTPHGAIKVQCDTSSVGLPHCTARQKACG